jgi:flagellar biosynthesis/type III secretory pathway protein FliH
MARVIKGGNAVGGTSPAPSGHARPATRVLVGGDVKKVIDRELLIARSDSEAVLRAADEERKAVLAAGKRTTAQKYEESLARGAAEAFASAAQEALEAFERRAERCSDAADDIRVLALAIVKKVLGTEPDLGAHEVERIVERGVNGLRARRKLRVQVAPHRTFALIVERPNLMKAVAAEPDFLVEDAADVGPGFARVLTEIGGALCAEETALLALANTVGVKEQPVRAPVNAHQAVGVQTAPPLSKTASLPASAPRVPPTRKLPAPPSHTVPPSEETMLFEESLPDAAILAEQARRPPPATPRIIRDPRQSLPRPPQARR